MNSNNKIQICINKYMKKHLCPKCESKCRCIYDSNNDNFMCPNVIYIKIKTACHRGGLKETLETEHDIQYEIFNILVSSGIYEFYAYDERIHAMRFLICDIPHNLGLPQWLHLYEE